MKYFSDILTTDQLKKRYRELAMQYHPDKSGIVEIMQEINMEYEQIQNMMKGTGPYEYKDIPFSYFTRNYFGTRREGREKPAYRQNVKAERGSKMDWRDFINKEDY